MIKFKEKPLKINHKKKLVFMTIEQVDANKYQIIKDIQGYKTTDGYDVCICFCYQDSYLPVPLLTDTLWQSLRALQVKCYTHGNDEQTYIEVTARVYDLHQVLLPYASGVEVPGIDISALLAENEGLVLLKDVIDMPDTDRDKLIESFHKKAKEEFENSPRVKIKGIDVATDELAHFIKIGSQFMIFDAETTERSGRQSILYSSHIIPSLLFACILCGDTEEQAVENTFNTVGGIPKDTIKTYFETLKL